MHRVRSVCATHIYRSRSSFVYVRLHFPNGRAQTLSRHGQLGQGATRSCVLPDPISFLPVSLGSWQDRTSESGRRRSDRCSTTSACCCGLRHTAHTCILRKRMVLDFPFAPVNIYSYHVLSRDSIYSYLVLLRDDALRDAAAHVYF